MQPANADLVASREGVAAIIQAIWSVLAVILAVITPGWHADVQAAAEYRRQMKLLGEIVTGAESALRAFAVTSGDVNAASAHGMQISIARWNSMRDSLNAFPATAVRTAREAGDLMRVRAVFAESVELVQRSKIGGLAWLGAADRVRILLDGAQDSFQHLQRVK